MQGVGHYSVLVDANVWFSRTLRDWIGMLYTAADEPPFAVYWTEDILAELLYHLRRKHPDWPGSRTRAIRDLLSPTYRGRDPHDAHVHAAAVACRADTVVTADSVGFVWDDNNSPYEVMTPDEFLVLVDDANPELVATVTSRMSDYWFRRAGQSDLPAALRRAGCPRFAERVLTHLQRMM